MNIGLDIDGVIYDWHGAVYTYFIHCGKFSGSYTDFWTKFIPEMGDSLLKYIMQIEILYETSSIDLTTLHSVEKLADLGEIYYITSRDKSLHRITYRFFKKSKIPFCDNLIFTDNKSLSAKLLDIDFFLDDQPKWVRDVSTVCDSWLISRPWNYADRDGLSVVGSLDEFYSVLSERISNESSQIF